MKSILILVILCLVLSDITPLVKAAAAVKNHQHPKNNQNSVTSIDKGEIDNDKLVLEKAKEELLECLIPLVNGPEIRKGLQNYTYAIQSKVFKSHCQRVPQLKACLNIFLTKAETLLEEEDKDVTEFVRTGASTVFEYLCHNDGERIIQFISSDGVKCFGSQALQVRSCFAKKIAEYEAVDSGESNESKESKESSSKKVRRMVKRSLLQDVVPNKDVQVEDFECEFIGELQQCAVKPLQECKNTTPASIVQGLFDATNKAGPCRSHFLRNQTVKQAPRKI